MQFCKGPRIRLSVCIMQHVDDDFFSHVNIQHNQQMVYIINQLTFENSNKKKLLLFLLLETTKNES